MTSPLRADWRDRAACTGRPATIALCRRCPVQPQCLDWAMRLDPDEDPDEIAGGYTRAGRGHLRVAGWPPAPLKRCGRCGEAKDRGEYTRMSRALDGLHPHCRPCKRAEAAAYYRAKKGQTP